MGADVGRPPVPAPARCIACGFETDWVWDDDLPAPGEQHVPEPGYEIDGEWWGQAYHCSRWCYLRGAEYAARGDQ